LPPLAGTVQLRPDTGGDPLCHGGAQLFQRGKGLSHHCGWEGHRWRGIGSVIGRVTPPSLCEGEHCSGMGLLILVAA